MDRKKENRNAYVIADIKQARHHVRADLAHLGFASLTHKLQPDGAGLVKGAHQFLALLQGKRASLQLLFEGLDELLVGFRKLLLRCLLLLPASHGGRETRRQHPPAPSVASAPATRRPMAQQASD